MDYRKKSALLVGVYSIVCLLTSFCLIINESNCILNGCLYRLVTCLAQSCEEGAEGGGVEMDSQGAGSIGPLSPIIRLPYILQTDILHNFSEK